MLLSAVAFISILLANILIGYLFNCLGFFKGRGPFIALVIIADISIAIFTGEKLWPADTIMYIGSFLVSLISPSYRIDYGTIFNILIDIIFSEVICIVVGIITLACARNNIIHTGEYVTTVSNTETYRATKDYETDQLVYPESLLKTLGNLGECQVVYESRTDFALDTITTSEKTIDNNYRTPKIVEKQEKTTYLLHVPSP